MNQGKKSVAHRSTPVETQIRRVLQAAGSTICGTAARGAAGRPAGFAQPRRANRGAARPGGAAAVPS
ncbi:hypothetical protein DID97_15390 [Burkholderia sp. Bp8977]|nr:hypothetical protein DIE10_16790 [Burkholderia sp. Bp9011]RQR91308.1 hypothetical protein DIE09_19030 [Burkholderia sp. Bp9010]RQS05053.1 hypothetical protein DIE02_16690 [Burkholderia sp. Bp8991]RQS26186.1 hypothetical protein DIE05_21700 [Burkholderia sp. Bp8995]RQS40615.1 hypothetical protein DIE00_30880 [Burkholderia sp. Bp8989]RQS75723.1 hypothetical protein DID97_15390 [Burkholderia sp. Bp8977]